MSSPPPPAKCSLPVYGGVCFYVTENPQRPTYVTAQPTYDTPSAADPYTALAQAGIRSVVCVRDPQEITTQPNPYDLTEAEQLILANVYYTNISLPHTSEMKQTQFDRQAYDAAKVIATWPAPVLVHCSTGDRASAVYAVFLIAFHGATNAAALHYATHELALQNKQFKGFVLGFKKP